jgi:hypothetical protein
VSLRVHGLAPGSYQLSSGDVNLAPAGRDSVILSISPDLPHGLHSFSVDASAASGWTSSFQVQHFAEKES